MEEKERTRALDLTMGQIEKQFGKGSIVRLGSKEALVPVSVISTGSISVDAALGVGGFPRGRINEIYGPESSGKTTIALQVIAEAQKKGGMAAFIDVEHALDPIYAKKLGVDVDNLLVSQPDYGEQALEITSALISSGTIDVLVVDSVAALVPKAELEGEMGDSHMGLQARLMSQALRKLTGADRAMLYRVASRTGFRAHELASLTPASFDLAGDDPAVPAAAGTAAAPPPPDVAEARIFSLAVMSSGVGATYPAFSEYLATLAR